MRGDRGNTLLCIDSLSLAPGECVAIRGPSGAGKSTLLFALAGIAECTTGSVRWGSIDLLSLSAGARARFRRNHLGLIFQDYLLFDELSAACNARITAAFSRPEKRSCINNQAHHLLTDLGIPPDEQRSVASFSGGERQRVAVARALANDPAVILADEPTASLDREAADRLIDDLTSMAVQQQQTLVVVSHDHVLHTHMNRLLTLIDGRVVDDVTVCA